MSGLLLLADRAAATLADTAPSVDVGGEQIAFWILAPLALLGAVGMVFAKVAVHSALWLVLTMLCLGCLYMMQGAQFLGVLMLTGRDAGDSVIEVLRGQRVKAALVGLGIVALIVSGLVRALRTTPFVGLSGPFAERGPIGSLAAAIFTDYLFPFELTSALLITAAVGAMVLAHVERAPGEKKSQRQRVTERMRSERMSPLPGPGVFATSSSNATPALLPDGSVAPGSVSGLVEQSESQRVVRAYRSGTVLKAIEGGDHPVRRPDDGATATDGDGAAGVVEAPVSPDATNQQTGDLVR